MARYRYLFTDLMSGRVLSDAVALSVSSYSRRLCSAGTCSAELFVAAPQVRDLTDPLASTEPRRTALWIIRNETPAWGGIIWSRRYRSGDGTFDLGAQTFESYFARRRIRETLTFGQVDQHTIVTDLVNHAQRQAYGSIGIATGGGRPSGVRRDRTYLWHERATYLERLEQLSEVDGGPDFAVGYEWDEHGVPVPQLRVGTPLGSDVASTVIEFPGDVRNYAWPDDGADSANFWTAIGEHPEGTDPDEPPPMRDATLSAEWSAGYPLLEDVSTHQGTHDGDTLAAYARAQVLAAAGNRVVPTATLRLREDDALPTLGDVFTVRLSDPYRFPSPGHGAPGLVARVRVTGWTVHMSADEGETLELTLAEVA